MQRLLIFLALALGVTPLAAQNTVTLNPEDFVYPIREVAGLYSANFGELRSNHFHSGIDIKTGGETGKPVVAVADGYIARIAVTPGGYGRAVYIVHPNGTTSVYGHLESFRADIERYVEQERYRLKQNSINLYFTPEQFPLKQGEEFARSGNTGSSSGPHLHFEIRDTRTSRTLNTIAAGVIRTHDDIAPRIVRLHYIEVDSVRGVPVHSARRAVEVTEIEPRRYILKENTPLRVGRRGYFLLEVTDRKNDVTNTFGVWRLTMRVEDDPRFELQVNDFAFGDTRYCNAVAYYPLQLSSRNAIFRLAQLECNACDMYTVMKNRGLVTSAEGQMLRVEIEAEDDSGNVSTLSFDAVGMSEAQSFHVPVDSLARIIDPRHDFRADTHEYGLFVAAGALYEPIFFQPEVLSSAEVAQKSAVPILTPIYRLIDRDIPLHKAVTASIRAYVPAELQSKATLGTLSRKGVPVWNGGKYRNGMVTTTSQTVDYLFVAIDSVPPTVTPRFTLTAEPYKGRSVSFKLGDNFSGVASYEAMIDGEWVLLERNPMRGTVTHTFREERTPRGATYDFVLTVTDGCGNRTVWQEKIRR